MQGELHYVLTRLGVGVYDEAEVAELAHGLIGEVADADVVVADKLGGEYGDAGYHIVFAYHDAAAGVFARGLEDGLGGLGHYPCHMLAFNAALKHGSLELVDVDEGLVYLGRGLAYEWTYEVGRAGGGGGAEHCFVDGLSDSQWQQVLDDGLDDAAALVDGATGNTAGHADSVGNGL